MSIDILQLAQEARDEHGYTNMKLVKNRVIQMIQSNRNYMDRRARRGIQTPTDTMKAEDNLVLALIVEQLGLLQSYQELTGEIITEAGEAVAGKDQENYASILTYIRDRIAEQYDNHKDIELKNE